MRMIITLTSLGLTLALGLGDTARAAPGGIALLEGRDAAAQTQNYYLHKKYYRHNADRARGDRSGTTRNPNQDAVGTANPDVRKPVVRG